jgi:type I restriction enzyme S subunit
MISSLVPWQLCALTDWPVIQVKYVFDISLGKMLQPNPNNADDVETTYIKAVNVQWSGIGIENLPTMWASSSEIKSLNLKIGDLLVCEGGEVGRASILSNELPENCIYQNALHRVRSENNDVRYLKYCLKQASEAGWFDVLCNRATIAHFTVEKFRELQIHIPPQRIQSLIADYLDRETAYIDELVAEKEKMLALLEEKRSALISRAVTRGLNPEQQLKPCGFDWLGEIPAHWEIARFKFVCELNPAVSFSQFDEFEEVTFLSMDRIKNGYYIQNIEPLSKFNSSYNSFSEGDIIIAKVTPCFENGNIAIAVNLVNKVGFGSSELFVLRPYQINRNFMFFYLQSQIFKQHGEASMTGAGGLKRVSPEMVRDHLFGLPPDGEQEIIAEYLSKETLRISKIKISITESIDLLKERRAALITAAVTGHIPIEEMNI